MAANKLHKSSITIQYAPIGQWKKKTIRSTKPTTTSCSVSCSIFKTKIISKSFYSFCFIKLFLIKNSFPIKSEKKVNGMAIYLVARANCYSQPVPTKQTTRLRYVITFQYFFINFLINLSPYAIKKPITNPIELIKERNDSLTHLTSPAIHRKPGRKQPTRLFAYQVK